jgi:hypothetical protein
MQLSPLGLQLKKAEFPSPKNIICGEFGRKWSICSREVENVKFTD